MTYHSPTKLVICHDFRDGTPASKKMNIYEIITRDEFTEYEKCDAGMCPVSRQRIWARVAAESRGKARGYFVKWVNTPLHEIEWTTPMSITLVEKNVKIAAGVL